MRIRPLLLLVPAAMAGTLLLAAPPTARAANGMTETGTTTYEVIPSQNLISVTVQISIYNATPNETASGGIIYYYWNSTGILVPASAGPITASSNTGAVSQSIKSSDQYYKVVRLSYPSVYYGQTRVVTASYTIPAQPGAKGGFRAGVAYASLCAVGNGQDTGSVSVIVPDGFDLRVVAGDKVSKTDDSNGKQTFSSGTVAKPVGFASCVEAADAATLTHATVTIGDQAFDLRGWPEDLAWTSTVRDELNGNVQRLEDLTGLVMPGGKIVIAENGGGLNDGGIEYNAATSTLGLPETPSATTLAHAVAHVWFNGTMFKSQWVSEGLAGYSERVVGEGNYTPCADPGVFPGSGSPTLRTWQTLTYDSSTQDQNVAAWQAGAACYFFTTIGNAMGPDGFRAVVRGAAVGEMAYQGATQREKPAGAGGPLTDQQVLDLIDELGMVPAGISDLDQAQTLLAQWGVFDATTLAARSESRSRYHALVATAGSWHLPLAVRAAMSGWDFPAADKAMATAGQILDLRSQIEKQISGFSLDGTDIQKKFEAAATQADLDGLLALTKQEADASGQIDNATKLRAARPSVLQSVGLLGADLDGALSRARSDLHDVRPDAAISEAQSVTNLLNGASGQGLLRSVAVLGILLVLLTLAVVVTLLRRRRRKPATDRTGNTDLWIAPPGLATGGPQPQIIEYTDPTEPTPPPVPDQTQYQPPTVPEPPRAPESEPPGS